jgi:hypothetical protein
MFGVMAFPSAALLGPVVLCPESRVACRQGPHRQSRNVLKRVGTDEDSGGVETRLLRSGSIDIGHHNLEPFSGQMHAANHVGQ